MNAIETARRFGEEYAAEVKCGLHGKVSKEIKLNWIPDGDYAELVRTFGECTSEMEKAYLWGFEDGIKEGVMKHIEEVMNCTVCGAQIEIDREFVDIFGPLSDPICESCLQAEKAQHFCRTEAVLPRPGYLTQE